VSTAASGLRTLVRAPLWWSAKLLPLVAAAELAALTARVDAGEGVPRLLAMLVSAVSVAAAAHVVNDLADLRSDRVAGRPSHTSTTSVPTRVVVLLACAAGAVTPWLIVSLDPVAGAILVALVVLSGIYSLPPIRLKARGGAGVLADALVAHSLPTAFAFVQLGAAGTRTAMWWVAFCCAMVWATAFGVRSIVVHQVLDHRGDLDAGVSTFVVTRGVPRAVRLGRDAVALEVAGLIGLLAASTQVNPWLGLAFVAHFALWANHRRFDPTPIDTVPTAPGAWLPLAEFYEVWPAVGFGLVLVTTDAGWWWVLGTALVVFAPAVLKQARSFLALLAELVHECVALVRRRIGMKPFWATYRGYWRLRHAMVDPLVAVIRRNRRRVRRRLGGDDRRAP